MDREQLMALLDYESETGTFRWKAKPSRKTRIGTVAGTTMSHGYVRIVIQRRFYYAHRLAWLFASGQWPVFEIDHINGNRADNRILNLRAAGRVDNGANLPLKVNNTSGVAGVSLNSHSDRWEAYIMRNRRKIWLGSHAEFDDAVAARKAAERRIFGEFVRAA